MREVLKQSGLNEKQASVYLALLELGTASVHGVAQKAGIKRPTTYLVLDELEQKGLVSIVPQKKTLYTAESPDHIISQLYKKQELLKQFLPNLLAIYNAKKDKPQVQMFPGKEGVKQIYQKIFAAKEVSFFGTIKEVSQIYPEGLEGFLENVEKGTLKARDLLTPSAENLAYAAQVVPSLFYKIRFLPADMQFSTDSALFTDHVVFFSFRPQVFAVMITSREITQSLKTLYELAWQTAVPAHQYIAK